MARSATCVSRYFKTSRPLGTKVPITVASTPSECAQIGQLLPTLRRHGQHHPFLGLGDPDLGVREPFVFQRHAIELDLGADMLAHFAHGAGEAAGAAIGDGVVQPAVAAASSTSSNIFSVIALPICTAPPETVSLWLVSSAELKVAPWMPSRPVRPPRATIRSPAWAACGICRGGSGRRCRNRPAGCPGSGGRNRSPR